MTTWPLRDGAMSGDCKYYIHDGGYCALLEHWRADGEYEYDYCTEANCPRRETVMNVN